ncbi:MULTISPECIES: N-formylglutamate deformylase [unclassified Janthinobacterium]|uniref:N-formylglutamate deformylase n=1 Tax=unclassified Janthinobacterium TaxID=2610881 RepID=UPI001608C9DB|nr:MULTISPECIES: N-formylglutamate deformylase [unclassified Janthinobacterium]MBB5607428.1 N-formylglutamate deformylase [Janthinobacterium sp. S3T4]MBB5612449.1 N-formylglutamate deformylase [Janthinobacterium sp. S3M3]
MDFRFNEGSIALLVSMPHVGTDIPDDIAARLTPQALQKADTDWHLRELYGFLREMDASVLSARWSRYTIDLNRPQEDTNLYPGQDTTGLLPHDTFHREALYLSGQEPDAAEVQQRVQRYWAPYHRQLRAELDRLLRVHGAVVLWDAHSIASHVPRFFDGKLPDLNFGTADGASCDAGLAHAVMDVAQAQDQFTLALNGRFKGGHITRHYGQPAKRVHAIQLEMCQCLYMDEASPFGYRPEVAAKVQPLLRQMMEAALTWVQR